MRTYKAARRAAKRAERAAEPHQFTLAWDEDKPTLDDDGQPVLDDAGDPVLEPVEQTATFTVHGEIGTLAISEFALMANAADEEEAQKHGGKLAEVFMDAIDDAAEYTRFSKIVRKHFDDEELMEVMGGIIEDQVGRPTRESSPSSDSPLVVTATEMSGDSTKVVHLQGGYAVASSA